jgi:outer membrane protein assembly factor BamB
MRSIHRLAVCTLASILFGTAVSARQASTSPDAPQAVRDWPMFNVDVARTGVFTGVTGITAANVGSLQRRQVQIDEIVDSSAIYLHGAIVNGAAHDTIFITTSYGRTRAIDAASGATLWTHTPDGYDTWAGSRQITNATPVADPGRQFIYAASPGGQIQKLAVSDGHAVWSTPITRLPAREKIASPLSLFRGRIIAVTGGYIGDAPPYQGHVSILDAATGAMQATWNSLCSDRPGLLDPTNCPQAQSAIWSRGGAVIDPATGNIFVTTGNGPWDGRTAWGDSLIELDPTATRMLGNWTPDNNEALARIDMDLGTTSAALLGGGFIVQGGKDGLLRLLSERTIAGTEPHRGGELQVVQVRSGGRQRASTAPVVMRRGSNTWLIAADSVGTYAYQLRDGKLEPAWSIATPGTAPVVAGGLLYVYDPAGAVHVREPETGKEIASLPCGPGHWSSPIVVDGRIILPEGNANRPGASVINIWQAR